MKKLITVCVFFALSGCAAVDSYLMKYDTNEYKLVTDIRASAQSSKTECDSPTVSKVNANNLAGQTNLYMLYAQYLPHNDPVIKASTELNNIAQGLKEQYASGTQVSPAFCKIKFEMVEHSAESIQKIVGAKPR
jgi:hypothetical protein